MKRKLKICFRIFLIILITSACIACGIQARYKKGIVVTQFGVDQDRSMGYMLETENGRIIMIDGGLSEYSSHIIEVLKQKGGVVDAWYITHAHIDHASVLLDTLDSNEIQINGIYVSLNSSDWYEENESDEGQKQFALELIDKLGSENVRDKVHEVNVREEINFDNLNFKILKNKEPRYVENAGNNQSMVIKVSNNFKNMLFLGDLGEEYQDDFINANKDEIKSTAVQMGHHGQKAVNQEVYNLIDPEYCFWPTPEWLWNNDDGAGYNSGDWKTIVTRSWIDDLGVKENYVAKDGDITVRIW